MEEAKNAEYDSRLAEDERIARKLGLEGVPGFVLVKEGEVITQMAGAYPYRTFRSLLSLG